MSPRYYNCFPSRYKRPIARNSLRFKDRIARRHRKEKTMCDYSLMGVPNRLATEGEELLVHRFSTGSLGLASPSDLRRVSHPLQAWLSGFWFFRAPEEGAIPAVCIPPGAQLWLQ